MEETTKKGRQKFLVKEMKNGRDMEEILEIFGQRLKKGRWKF